MKKRITKDNFDGIADKFDNNIYGTRKGQLRHQLLLNAVSPHLSAEPMQVLDAGGGTGMMALEFAKNSHAVTLVDLSAEALDMAKKRLAAYPNIQYFCEGLLDHQQSYDFILCHAVLEWVDEPQALLRHLVSCLKPNGTLSLSFFNQDAKVFNNLLYGNFDYVKRGLPAKNTVRLNPHNAQHPKSILAFINSLPSMTIQQSRGIRCFHDYMLDKQKIEEHYPQLVQMEMQLGVTEPYKWLGKYFHILATKSS